MDVIGEPIALNLVASTICPHTCDAIQGKWGGGWKGEICNCIMCKLVDSISSANKAVLDEADMNQQICLQEKVMKFPRYKCVSSNKPGIGTCVNLPLTVEHYQRMEKECDEALITYKCIASKIKIPLINYIVCKNDKYPNACFQKLGFSADQLSQFEANCKN